VDVILQKFNRDYLYGMGRFERKRRQLPRADEPQAADAAVGVAQPLPLSIQFPPRLLVLHRAAIPLEAREALLARSLLATIAVEALDGRPGAGGGCLTGLRVEAGGEGLLMREAGTEDVQIVGRHAPSIQPQAEGFVADELRRSDRLVYGSRLGASEAQLVLVQEHAVPLVVYRCGQ
jgi:hypothetical protein